MIFTSTNNQIREFGNAILLANFSYLLTQLIYSVDFRDHEKESVAEQFRSIVYETFNNQKGYVDEKVKLIEDKQEQYVQSLYAQGLVFLWARLESLVKQLITALIDLERGLLTKESFRLIKIPMTKYFELADDEKMRFLAELIFNSMCDHKYGIYKLECYLDTVGLSGGFNEKHKRNVIVLHQMRNCIVHNDSVADAKFCENCTWMNYQVGDKFVVTDKDFRAYETSVLAYIQEIFYRLNQSMGAPDRYLQSLRRNIDSLFVNQESIRES